MATFAATSRRADTRNYAGFSCPGCERRFAPEATRIGAIAGEWYCRRCFLGLEPLRQAADAMRSTKGESRVPEGACSLCDQPFATQPWRRIVEGPDGHAVHYRCPRSGGRRRP